MNFRLCRFVLAATLLAPSAHAEVALQTNHLQCEYKTNPLGVDAPIPRLSWQLQSSAHGQRQTAYEVMVSDSQAALNAGQADLWDSGKVASDRSTAIDYAGKELHSNEVCFWRVRVWDKDGKPDAVSSSGFWQMGLLQPTDWKGQWIAAQTPRKVEINGSNLPPSPYVRRSFTLDKPVRQATIYVSARGMYELHLNGAKVGDAVLAPGWTDYSKRIQYQAYDVTSSVHEGANAVGAILGDGWYSGYIGFGHRRDYYGTRPELKLQIEVKYVDGTQKTIASDASWRGSTGPILYSDMLQGETFDARKIMIGWDTPAAKTAGWRPVEIGEAVVNPTQVDVTHQLKAMAKDNTLSVAAGNDLAGDPAYNTIKQLRVDYTLNGAPHTQTADEHATIQIPGPGETPGTLVIRRAVYGALTGNADSPPAMVSSHAPPVRVTQHMPARRISEPTPGTYIVDLGQNMVGWARLRVHGPTNTRVRLRFGEVLNPNGTLYTANLRSARSTDTYICRGGGVETWEPHFTFHGFRYVEVTGYPGKPPLSAILGCVVGSDTPVTGDFTCSNPLVNQLQKNIVWGQRGNFLSVPTDCPQRDERLGWMGDAQIFARTATYNRDVAAFYEKWLQDVDDAQSPEGGFADVSPRVVDSADGAPAWGDAGIIVPWTVYQAYDDTAVLQAHWTSMTHWMDYITSVNPNGLWLQRRNNDFGDWLSIAADTPKDVLATGYYAYDAELMARMAQAIGRTDDAAKYEALFSHIKDAFDTAYVTPDGKVMGDTQTSYLVALRFDLLPDNLRPLAAQHLVDDIRAKGNHLSTGFVGVGYLCPTLTETGHNDVAYKLLLQDTFPSWGYSIKQGATTIWERWDGYTKNAGFQDPAMNSFNHYSLGSVGQWLYQDVAGIDTDPAQPGFQHILLHPHPGPGLHSVSAHYDSLHGRIVSNWKVANRQFVWDITIPANTTATAWIPTQSAAAVTEGGKKIDGASGITFTRQEDNRAVYELPSGNYHFAAPLPAQ